MDKFDDNKFAHLLQPIRDLAANWDINIANELEDYLVSLFHASLVASVRAADLSRSSCASVPVSLRWRIGCAGRIGKRHLFF